MTGCVSSARLPRNGRREREARALALIDRLARTDPDAAEAVERLLLRMVERK